ncbi:MAG: hypothetical protein NNC24_03790 [Candidatus Nanosynbacter sp. P11B_S7_bin.28.1]|nr:hypothetical protein [Candidatus Nanosynbacter sp. P11B_S7_bin.28.1]
MLCIDYGPNETNTDAQLATLNNDTRNFGFCGKASKVGDEKLENDTIESSQNSDDYYQDLEALTEAADNEETKKNMAKLAALCAGVYPMGECDIETGTLF